MTQTEGTNRESKDLTDAISRKRLVNILNYANFEGTEVVVNLRSLQDGSRLTLRAAPGPCCGEIAPFSWSESPPVTIGTAYDLIDFFIDTGSKLVIVGGMLADIGRSGVRILLPEQSYAISRRRLERYKSVLTHVTLSRNGAKITGLLRDFGGGFIRVRIATRDLGLLKGTRSKVPLQVNLARGETSVYSGKGLIKRRMMGEDSADIVLTLLPASENKPEGNFEVVLDPALVATYRHPLSDKIVRVHVVKTSYNSLVIREHPEHLSLFQGLIIPEMRIDFGTGDSTRCTAKVVGGEIDTWFVSVLDMSIPDQRRLFSFIEKERGVASFVCPDVDPSDLVEFFFESGFIYPEKYIGMLNARDHLKKMLSHLYIDTPLISQHFVQDNRGVIEAHIAMLRFYEQSWIIHHHSALGNGAGSNVLSQVFQYVNSYSSLPSSHMDYLLCYYRHNNRFPNRVLGGFARFLSRPDLCSVDPFAYLHYEFSRTGNETHRSLEWQIEPINSEDVLKLEAFYQDVSGGLMLRAFGVEATHDGPETEDLDLEFKKVGLRRQKLFFSLRNKAELKAVIMALDSDDGLNMSNLTKCIHIFVIDKEDLNFDILINQLNRLSTLYEEAKIPMLIFPESYVNEQGVSPEKIYDLLVVRSSVCKQFAEFTERLTMRAVRRKYGLLTQELGGEASGQ